MVRSREGIIKATIDLSVSSSFSSPMSVDGEFIRFKAVLIVGAGLPCPDYCLLGEL